MSLLLAPMEGLLDFVLRDILTRVGGVDRCVSEFIRVTGTLLPERVYHRVVPEMHNQWRTLAGVPVRPQFMGSDPVCLAENAARAASLGAPGVDLNFGCPAKVVNRHGGGAALLQDPDGLLRIVEAVRAAVPTHLPVSAKMRLGFMDDRLAEACAQALEAGGASELVVHARTKADGYQPPAHWHRVADIRNVVRVPVVANGEIWTADDAARCRAVSGSTDLMLGRGMVVNPGLALSIVQPERPPVSWDELLPLLGAFWQLVSTRVAPRERGGRIKQWLNFLRRHHPQAQSLYELIKPLTRVEDIEAQLLRVEALSRSEADTKTT